MGVIKFLKRIFDWNEREIARLRRIVDQINALEPEFERLTDEQASRSRPDFHQRRLPVHLNSLQGVESELPIGPVHDLPDLLLQLELEALCEGFAVDRSTLEEYLAEGLVGRSLALVCEYFSELTGVNVDPFKAISEGTLLLTARPEKAREIVAALESEKIPASIVGEVVPEEEGITVIKGDGEEMKLTHPQEDPFWPAFYKTLEIIEECSK